jgi:hypothetical protein
MGDGSVNNAIGWGQGANNAIGWGDIHADSWAGLTDISGAPSVDADAQAFITAASITDATQQSAINQLVVDLKGYGIWTKMKALYPFVGGTASTHKFNLKDPRDLDAAFRLVFSGGITHSSTGITFGGVNGYANTKLNLNSTLILNNSHSSIYSRTNNAAAIVDMGCEVVPNDMRMHLKWTDNNSYYDKYDQSIGRITYAMGSTASTGLFIANRTSNINFNVWRNSNKLTTKTTTNTSSLPSREIFIGADNAAGGAGISSYSNRNYAFASLGDGLSDTEAANFYTAVQAFQTTLGRSIDTQTVSDADAQAFVTNANIQDQVQATAINNLVIGLKADSLWTKMKAIYPFVGGDATSHKFNLKDPQDTNAAFRLIFSGGWTHSSTGATPNGTNSYANTNFRPLTNSLSYTNNHISYYSRAIAAGSTIQFYEMGSGNATGTDNLALFTRRNTDLAGYDSGAFSTNRASFSNTNGRGFYCGTAPSTTAKYFKNGVSQATKSLSASSISDVNVYLGGFNENNSTIYYSNKEVAFASIGTGLSDTEAANFYTRVNNFQIALDRNV